MRVRRLYVATTSPPLPPPSDVRSAKITAFTRARKLPPPPPQSFDPPLAMVEPWATTARRRG